MTRDTADQLVVDCSPVGAELRVVVSGELDAVTERQLVAAATAAIDESGIETVVVDVAALSFIDSAGLRALMLCRDHAAKRRVPMKLIPGTGVVPRLLKVAGVAEWFCYD